MIFKRLAQAGVLGLNARNAEFINRYNPRHHFRRVDDKLLARELADAVGVRVPALVGVVEAYGELRSVGRMLEGLGDFVIKPVQGAMGSGVLVVVERRAGAFVLADGRTLTASEVEYHLTGILAGLHSLGGRVDRAMIEERLVPHPELAALAFGGVPDVRVIVFRGVPVLAMVRLPTRASRGRANLHQGAVAAGIELQTGRTVGGLHRERALKRHPETDAVLAGHLIPEWPRVLEWAVRAADAFGLGYVGIDIVLDARHGPVLLEANARPGLAIQLANARGLRPRLEQVERLALEGLGVDERVAIGRALP